ncbi:DUF2303 family protein [Pseudomonas syringae]|uniref:DUF2303 family protein n=1 Tax=Pseudomonas syringae TaxID=317 RepID=UPI00031548B7|nr:DUF2303 family protein [Pseudomonas syringae]AQL40067.1 hypothetical protein JN853_29065 [Pseudomonas syringae pv. actinidiae ICMP 9853]EPM83583.1 hypothetical protein A260_23925 [Pseudomonas syringae pv. actinidiae ICMP 19068]EPM93795.1 hypothetical protein A258_23208 [Pseudomonas syringae pv. actinidiae ICMP 19104]EPN08311.1 hypothetical protein A252_23055 [Pseudomonas syringae pv. actinidiae ICMP 9855]KCU95277.1 hypothetical protein A250_25246 [Pseudomonas syringae pv. actinidiae ICMP 96
MEAKAIQLIQDTAVIANAKALDTFTPSIALPATVNVVSLEKFQQTRSRFRGVLETSSLKDFSEYVLNQADGNTSGFVDSDDMTCTVFFNLGNQDNPGHGDFRAKLTLKKTAAFIALERAAGSKHTQKELSDFIEDWAPNLTALTSDGADIDLRRAAGAIRSITIEQARKSEHIVGDMSASRSAMDQIEAKSADGLPAELLFSVNPYEGLQAQTIQLRVAVLTGGDQPVLRLRWIGEAQLREDLAQEFKQVVAQEVGGATDLTIGSFTLA